VEILARSTASRWFAGRWAAWWWATAFVVVAAGTVVLIFFRPRMDRLADLNVYAGASRAVLAGLPLYGFHAQNGDPFTYPPFAVLGFLPLGRLPDLVLGVGWTIATLAAVVAVSWVVVQRWPVRRPEQRPALVWAGAVALLVSAPGQSNVRFGQVSVFLVLLTLADALGVCPARWRGVLLGAATAVKLTPGLFIVYYLLTGRPRDAVRAATTFVVCTVAAAVVLPGDSRAYWTSALFSTARIGDLAAAGNQSVNGVLLRAGLPGAWRPVVWLLVVAGLCGAALWRARALSRDGHEVHAVVLVGCATLAASPVSWTHHQFWTVLAGIVMVAGPVGVRRVAGWLLLASMTVSLVDIVARLPVGGHAVFLAANMRALAVAVLCVAGFGHLTASRHREHAPQPISPAGRFLARRPTRPQVVAVLAAAGLYAAMPLPGGADSRLQVSSPAQAIAVQQAVGTLTADLAPCVGRTWPQGTCEGPALSPESPVNYSVGYGPGTADVEGFAAAAVARLDYLPAPGADPVSVPLAHLAGGDAVFAFTAGDTTYAQLKAYDHQGRFIAETGDKLRN